MIQRGKELCKLAQFANKDKSLIHNHTINGVPHDLKSELRETKELLEYVKSDNSWLDLLEKEIDLYEKALLVYV